MAKSKKYLYGDKSIMKKGYDKPILSISEMNENMVLTNSGLNDSFNKAQNEIETVWGDFWN